MKIKRFFAKDIRDAIKQVREEQGPDAVILSNRQMADGIEIVAAVDYDEGLFYDLLPENARSRESETNSEPEPVPPSTHDSPPAEPTQIDAVVSNAQQSRKAGRQKSRYRQRKIDRSPKYVEVAGDVATEVEQRVEPSKSISQVEDSAFEIDSTPEQKQPAQVATVTRLPVARKTRKPSSRSKPKPQQRVTTLSQFEESLNSDSEEVAQHDLVNNPTLLQMRREIHSVRDLLEHQMNGLAWGTRMRCHPAQTRLLQLLMESGFDPELCEEVVEQIPNCDDFAYSRRLALGILSHRLPTTGDDILSGGGVIALVGPTGVGKTTTLAKLAARYALRHGPDRIALVSTDNFRVGAHEQLRTYGRLLDVPVRIASSPKELDAIIASLKSRSLVLVDTAGLGQRDKRVKEQTAILQNARSQIRRYLVLPSTTELRVLGDTIGAFQGDGLAGGILTKVDEATSLGAALSAIIQRQLPVAYICDGQRVPEDMRIARAHSLISRSMAITKQSYRRQRQAQNAMVLASDDDFGRQQSNSTKHSGSSQLANNVSMAAAFSRKSIDAPFR